MKKTGLFLILNASCVGIPEIGRDPFSKNLSWADMDLDKDGVGENYITSVKT